MAESRLLVDEKKIKYTGLINVKGLYRCAKDFLSENDYDPYEARNEEEVYEDGKQIILWMYGEKKLSNFAKVNWESKFLFQNLQEMSVEKDGKKVKMHKGSVLVETNVFLMTDYDKSFEQNSFQYFLRVVIDKFVFKSYINRAADTAKKHYSKYEEKIKGYLNLESFK
jgi:hypothetical protein